MSNHGMYKILNWSEDTIFHIRGTLGFLSQDLGDELKISFWNMSQDMYIYHLMDRQIGLATNATHQILN